MDSTLAKGLAVMEWMARQARACRVTDVANAFGMARSNAHRTLQTLVECGWAVQDADTSAYRPSLRLFELGAMVSEAADIGALLRPHLAALAQASGETIHLAVLDGAEIVYLDKFDSPLPVAAYSRIGGRAPACCVASGKAMLAAARLDAAALRALFARCSPTRRTASSTSMRCRPSSSAAARAAMPRTARNGAWASAASACRCSTRAARPWPPSA
jgi:IclR family KDG regulon transcriptional repressor